MSPNWSSAYAPLKLEPRQSPRLRRLSLVMFMGLAGCPWLTPLPAYIALGLSAAALGGLMQIWRRRVEFAGPPVTLTWARDGSWHWRQGGEEETVSLRADTLLTVPLVILNFDRPGRGRRSVMLLADNLDSDVFRRLRVRLRFEAAVEREEAGSA